MYSNCHFSQTVNLNGLNFVSHIWYRSCKHSGCGRFSGEILLNEKQYEETCAQGLPWVPLDWRGIRYPKANYIDSIDLSLPHLLFKWIVMFLFPFCNQHPPRGHSIARGKEKLQRDTSHKWPAPRNRQHPHACFQNSFQVFSNAFDVLFSILIVDASFIVGNCSWQVFNP